MLYKLISRMLGTRVDIAKSVSGQKVPGQKVLGHKVTILAT